MASLAAALFEEYSTLNANEIDCATESLGEALTFDNEIGPDGDPLLGTSGNDVFFITSSDTRINEAHNGGEDIVVSSASYNLPNHVEHLILTGSDDLNGSGNNQDNVIAGNDGNNLLSGGNGNDALVGGNGNDTLDGGNGDDTICAGSGDDSVIGGNGNDRIITEDGNDTVHAGTGDDAVFGGNNNDLIFGEAGDDSLDGGEGDDQLFGQTGDDSLTGGGGSDTLSGDKGDDTLIGGAGNDSLTGGKGDDFFSFTDGSGEDVIDDFEAGDDVIQLTKDINGSGILTGDDVLAGVTEDLSGNAVVDLGGGNTITLLGVDKDDLSASDFFIVE
ncbi:MAG: calcium-binding protein [Hyphomicrobiales bacterium]|nr:calcium-binding protein [Hyphomicrobiales bacterium]